MFTKCGVYNACMSFKKPTSDRVLHGCEMFVISMNVLHLQLQSTSKASSASHLFPKYLSFPPEYLAFSWDSFEFLKMVLDQI